MYKGTATPGKNFDALVEGVLSKCKIAEYSQTCYDKEIPALMDKPANLSMEEAFQISKLVQEKDKAFPYCHVLGHNLSAKEVKKDPSKWKEVLHRCPSGICSNGCIHGGFQERFRSEAFTDEEVQVLKPDLAAICEKKLNWNPTGLEQASCYHALGHLTMYITEADITNSIKLCEEIAVKPDGSNYLQVCLDGVFMQIFQPLEPEDFALIAGKQVSRDNVDAFCNQYQGFARASCISESWPLYGAQITGNPDALVSLCSKEEEVSKPRCFEGLFYVLVAQFNFDTQKIKNYCMALPENLQGKCFGTSSTRFMETDYRNISQSVELCLASDAGQKECFDELVEFADYNFHKGSPEFLNLCNSLPPPWKETCLQT